MAAGTSRIADVIHEELLRFQFGCRRINHCVPTGSVCVCLEAKTIFEVLISMLILVRSICSGRSSAGGCVAEMPQPAPNELRGRSGRPP
jgi:hypothetical protein